MYIRFAAIYAMCSDDSFQFFYLNK